jgi:hypothetical protein
VRGWQLTRAGHLEANDAVIRGGIIIGGTSLDYNGAPAAGNLIMSDSATSGTDPYGNQYIGGLTTYFNVGAGDYVAVNIFGNQITYWVNTVPGSMAGWVLGAQVQFSGTTPASAGMILIGQAVAAQCGQFSIGNAIGNSATWIFPSGDTTGATDIARINGALASHSQVHLIPGDYYVNAPVSLPSHGVLTGPPVARSSLYGAVIHATSGFSGNGVIIPAAGGDGYVVDGIALNGASYIAGTLHGVYAAGAAHSVILRHMGIRSFTGDGVHTERATNVPFSWELFEVESSNNAGNGFWATDMTDTSWLNCRAISNGLDGFATNPADAPGANSRFTGCVAETNSGNGWNIQGNGSTMAITMDGCSTQSNAKNGVYLKTSAAVSAFIQFTGCRFWEDGTAGGGGTNYAGIWCDGITGPAGFMIAGTSIQTQNTGTPVHPQYGLYSANCGGHARVSGSLLLGQLDAYHDGGGNVSVVIDGTTGQGTGPLSGITWSVP